MISEVQKNINSKVISCTDCKLHKLEINDNSKYEKGYGKLVSKEGKNSNKYMILGLNPSHIRFKGLKRPFDADNEFGYHEKKFVVLLMVLKVYDDCYISNIVKCSSLDNVVNQDSFIACSKYIIEEIEYANPRVIIVCGNKTYDYLLQLNIKNIKIEKILHPSFCFGYKRISLEEYSKQLKIIFDKYG